MNVQIGIAQFACQADKENNLQKAEEIIRKLAQNGAQIICLQELFTSLYFCESENYESFALAEAIPEGETAQKLQKLAKELAVVIVASLFEKRTAGIYHNTVVVLDADGTYLGKYRKMHIPDDPGFYEKFYFTPGDLGYQVFKTKYAKIGTLICWDQWFPEAARLTAMKGADFLVYPTAIGWDISDDTATQQEQLEAWQTIQKSHAIANGIPVISVNRIGREGNTDFWGSSFISNAFGKVIYQASTHKEELHVQTLNLSASDSYRTVWPFFRDRRIETYQDLTKRFLDE